MKYQAYEAYKDSGVEWLGEVPEHWEVLPTKRFFMLVTEPAPQNNDYELLSVYTDIGVKPRKELEQKGNKASTTDGYWLVQKNDIIINKLLAWMGAVSHSNYNGVTSPAYDILRATKDFNTRFYHYLFRSDIAKQEFKRWSRGIMEMRLRLYFEELCCIAMPFPPKLELNQIANFLDHETAKIDTLIEKQQQLIELLKEKRQAVISHAVTKGLNPDAPMKDSGVEWLGEVPEHWIITRAKYVSDIFIPQRNKPDINDHEGCAWVTMENMKEEIISSTSKFITNKAALKAGSKILHAGAVITSCVGNFGVTSINNIDVIINQQLQAFQPFAIKKEYLQYIVSMSKQYFELIGTSATLIYVNQEGFENLPVLLPPEDEQNSIQLYLKKKKEEFKKFIENLETQTTLLKERRAALISAAVTGKIDVRDWQAEPSTQNQAQLTPSKKAQA